MLEPPSDHPLWITLWITMSFRLSSLLSRYTTLLEIHPYKTNIASGIALCAIGDVMCQNMVLDVVEFDYRRCLSMMSFGGIYNGFINLWVYSKYPKVFPKFMKSTPARFGIAATLVDNFIHVPIFYTPGFYYITGIVQGQDREEINSTLWNGYFESMVR